MGHVIHQAVIATWNGYVHDGKQREIPAPDIEAFRDSMPEKLRPLLIGPFTSPINDYRTAVFLPCGSKTGWNDADEHEHWQEKFLDLFDHRYDDGGSPLTAVRVEWPEGGMSVSVDRRV